MEEDFETNSQQALFVRDSFIERIGSMNVKNEKLFSFLFLLLTTQKCIRWKLSLNRIQMYERET